MAGEEGHFCARSSFLELLTIFFKFIFGFAGVFVAEHWLSLVVASGGHSVAAQASHCRGFSCYRAQALECEGFSGCGVQTQ